MIVGPPVPEDLDNAGVRHVTISPDKGLVFAVRGLDFLRPKSVPTVYCPSPEDAGLTGTKSFVMGNRTYQVTHVTNARGPDEDSERDYDQNVLMCGNHKQLLATIENKSTTCPAWVGDLDGDGKPDVYVEEEFNGGRGTSTLFLSSLAGKGQLVGKAVEYDSEFVVEN